MNGTILLLKFYKYSIKKTITKQNSNRKSNLNSVLTRNFRSNTKHKFNRKLNLNFVLIRNHKNIPKNNPIRKLNLNHVIKQNFRNIEKENYIPKSILNSVSTPHFRNFVKDNNILNSNLRKIEKNRSHQILANINKNNNLSYQLQNENVFRGERKIIGYIHICQKGDWKRSLKILLDSIVKYKLYENTSIIRLCIVNNEDKIIDDEILKDEKFECLYFGKSSQYERPTLLHMRKKSEIEDNTAYYYLHTKGITHFNTPKEPYIIDWINLMLYWNIEKWNLAIEKLEVYDTYGCNDYKNHYSGNFWWAKCSHVKRLPIAIGSYYTATEDWVQTIRTNKFNVYSSGLEGAGHYNYLYPREKYTNEPALHLIQ